MILSALIFVSVYTVGCVSLALPLTLKYTKVSHPKLRFLYLLPHYQCVFYIALPGKTFANTNVHFHVQRVQFSFLYSLFTAAGLFIGRLRIAGVLIASTSNSHNAKPFVGCSLFLSQIMSYYLIFF